MRLSLCPCARAHLYTPTTVCRLVPHSDLCEGARAGARVRVRVGGCGERVVKGELGAREGAMAAGRPVAGCCHPQSSSRWASNSARRPHPRPPSTRTAKARRRRRGSLRRRLPILPMAHTEGGMVESVLPWMYVHCVSRFVKHSRLNLVRRQYSRDKLNSGTRYS